MWRRGSSAIAVLAAACALGASGQAQAGGQKAAKVRGQVAPGLRVVPVRRGGVSGVELVRESAPDRRLGTQTTRPFQRFFALGEHGPVVGEWRFGRILPTKTRYLLDPSLERASGKAYDRIRQDPDGRIVGERDGAEYVVDHERQKEIAVITYGTREPPIADTSWLIGKAKKSEVLVSRSDPTKPLTRPFKAVEFRDGLIIGRSSSRLKALILDRPGGPVEAPHLYDRIDRDGDGRVRGRDGKKEYFIDEQTGNRTLVTENLDQVRVTGGR
jgi:hypothetical protein